MARLVMSEVCYDIRRYQIDEINIECIQQYFYIFMERFNHKINGILQGDAPVQTSYKSFREV